MSAAQASEPVDGIAAVVDKDVITTSELDTAVVQIRHRMGRDAQRVPPDVLRSRVLDQLILKHLQTQRAERAGLQVTDQQVNQALDRVARQNRMSRQQFLAALQRQGMSTSALRQRLHDELLVNDLRRKEVGSRIVVTGEDVDRYLQSQSLRVQKNREYHIRHILVALPQNANSDAVKQAKARAQQLRQQAIDGKKSFADLAIAHSDGQKALKGGDLGWLSGGYLPTLFEDVIPKLKPGDVSQVFRGPSGYHLIKLVGLRQAGKKGEQQQSGMVREVHLLHILLKPNEIRNSERSHKLATQLRKRLEAGDDFGELARQYSDDNGSANQGGDLDWVQPEAYPQAFAKHIDKLKAGQISQPFHTQAGWHLVKVLGWRTRDKSEERRRNRARQAIGQRKMREQTQIWLHKIRDESYVDIRMPGYVGTASDTDSQ